jgi:hypothetical protein
MGWIKPTKIIHTRWRTILLSIIRHMTSSYATIQRFQFLIYMKTTTLWLPASGFPVAELTWLSPPRPLISTLAALEVQVPATPNSFDLRAVPSSCVLRNTLAEPHTRWNRGLPPRAVEKLHGPGHTSWKSLAEPHAGNLTSAPWCSLVFHCNGNVDKLHPQLHS